MSDQPIVVNAEAYWANLTTPNQMSGKFQIDLSNLSEAASEALKAAGVNVKNKGDEKGNFVTCKSNNVIRYYDKGGDEMTGVLVGNGSKVKAILSTYDWTSPTGKKGRSASIRKLVVSELVEFEIENAVGDVDLDEAL